MAKKDAVKEEPAKTSAIEQRLRRGGLAASKNGSAKAAAKPEQKTKRAKADWSTAESTSKNVSVLLAASLDTARREFGDPTIMVANEAGRLVLGLPLPSFSLEYLYQSNVLPFGRLTQLVGKEGTCKSGLGAEMSRWFIAAGGIGMLAEHESKYSPDWVPSIIGWHNTHLYGIWPCGNIEDWQKRILWCMEENERIYNGSAKEPGPGAVYPFLMTVDSIMGKLAKASQDKIAAAGFGSAAHALEANVITRYLKYATQRFEHMPAHLLLINHLKINVDAKTMKKDRNKIGGKCKEFLETYELEMERGAQIKMADYDGLYLHIKCEKNSLGMTRRRIPVSVRWWSEKIPEDQIVDPNRTWRQVTVWDWNESTINLLLSLEGVEGTRAKKIVDLRKVAKAAMLWSNRLGIPENAPVDFQTAGGILHANHELMQELREAFGIKMWTVWSPGIDYNEQRGLNRKAIAKMMDMRRKKDKAGEEE